MSDHVDPLPYIVESAKRTLFNGFFRNFILRKLRRGVESLFGDNSIFKRQNHHLAGMLMEPIDISSSDDSDFRAIDNYTSNESPLRDSATSSSTRVLPAESSNSRVLPAWSSQPSSNWTGNSGLSQRANSPKRSSVWNGGSSNFTPYNSSKPQGPGTSSGAIGTSYSATPRDDNLEYFSKNDDDWNSSKRAKRTLPTSMQPPLPNFRLNNLVENIGGSQFRGSHGNSYYPARPSSSNGEIHGRDRFGKGNDDDVVIYESKVNRLLPPSMMYGKSTSTSYANNESPYHRGVGEERYMGTDERLIFQAALQDLNQPKSEVDLPEGLLSVSLLRHQKIALRWMMLKETEGVNCLGGILADDQGLGKTVSMIAIIQAHKSLQEKSKSENLFGAKTEALNLDDDDDENGGAAPDKLKPKGEAEELRVISEGSSSLQFRNRKPAAGTLVVCPASVLRQWARELEEKVTEKLEVLVYHGGNRTRSADELAKYDVVLTTYAIVTNEVPKQPLVDEDSEQINGEKYGVSADFSQNKKHMKTAAQKRGKKRKNGYDNDANCGTLARVRWFRVILDEAQTIKNHRTQVARACCSLRAKRRWCLSGTPIQNAIDELFSYFRFLKYEPYCKYKSFCEGIKIPISRDSVRGYAKLQLILRSIMLRRTKGTLIDGQPIITLPPKTINLTKVDFTAQERAFYNKLEADSRSQFKAYADAGTLNQNYANILLMLLRLRQACDHPQLVKGIGLDCGGRESLGAAKKLPKQKLGSLLKLLETSFAICSACNDPPEDAVVTVCGHVFCFQCVSDYLTGEDNTCPAFECKEQLNADVIFSKATLRKCLFNDGFGDPSGSFDDEKSEVLKNNYSSSKIKAALDILQTYCKPSPAVELNSMVRYTADTLSSGNGCLDSQTSKPTKAIVFSQWTRMLDLVEVSLNNTGIKYQRLDGTMSLAARDKAVKEFSINPEVTVMLMSLKAGNLGLNMVAACRVILLDLWWNPTTEDQAIDRAHRIGQTRPVTVSRLTIRDTVEDRILALQEEKRKMVASAFGEDQSGASATRLTMEDLKYLFGV